METCCRSHSRAPGPQFARWERLAEGGCGSDEVKVTYVDQTEANRTDLKDRCESAQTPLSPSSSQRSLSENYTTKKKSNVCTQSRWLNAATQCRRWRVDFARDVCLPPLHHVSQPGAHQKEYNAARPASKRCASRAVSRLLIYFILGVTILNSAMVPFSPRIEPAQIHGLEGYHEAADWLL